ncbi:LPXTG cell wall anchor domain-containing protein [Corynebacterium propinquum]
MMNQNSQQSDTSKMPMIATSCVMAFLAIAAPAQAHADDLASTSQHANAGPVEILPTQTNDTTIETAKVEETDNADGTDETAQSGTNLASDLALSPAIETDDDVLEMSAAIFSDSGSGGGVTSHVRGPQGERALKVKRVRIEFEPTDEQDSRILQADSARFLKNTEQCSGSDVVTTRPGNRVLEFDVSECNMQVWEGSEDELRLEGISLSGGGHVPFDAFTMIVWVDRESALETTDERDRNLADPDEQVFTGAQSPQDGQGEENDQREHHAQPEHDDQREQTEAETEVRERDNKARHDDGRNVEEPNTDSVLEPEILEATATLLAQHLRVCTDATEPAPVRNLQLLPNGETAGETEEQLPSCADSSVGADRAMAQDEINESLELSSDNGQIPLAAQTFFTEEYGNIRPPELPKTGSNGIWNFVLGGLLLVVGGVFAAQRRRQA